MRRALFWVLSGLVGLSLLSAVFYKPTRVLAPTLFGLTCPTEGICLDDPGQLDRATGLRDAALAFVTARIGPVDRPPRVIFCATPACSETFGMEEAAGYAVGDLGIVIHPRGWQPHILRHEMIHHWQAERFGRLRYAYLLPRWYVEGMAYALSLDPRQPLPHPELEIWRQAFQTWQRTGHHFATPPIGNGLPLSPGSR